MDSKNHKVYIIIVLQLNKKSIYKQFKIKNYFKLIKHIDNNIKTFII